MTEGTISFKVVADASGLGSQVEDQTAGEMEKAGGEASSRFSAGLKKWGKRALKGGALAVGVSAGAALTSGIRSAVGREQTKKALTGFYGSMGAVEKQLKNVRKVAKKSAIPYESYEKATTALGYLNVTGDKATKVMDMMGQAISGAGGGAEEMDRATEALTRMSSEGRVTNQTLNQLSQAQVPIMEDLAAHMGTSIENVRKMAEKGEIEIDDVMVAIQKGQGATGKKMRKANKAVTESFAGQWANAKDAVILAIGDAAIPVLEKLAPVIGAAGVKLADFINAIVQSPITAGVFQALGAAFRGVGRALQFVGGLVGSVFGFFREHTTTAKVLGVTLGTVLAPALVRTGVQATIAGAKMVAGWTMAGAAAIKNAALSVASLATMGARWVWAGIQATVNGARIAAAWVMAMGPVGWVIGGLVAVGAGLVALWKKSETFRNIVTGVWNAVKVGIGAAWNGIKTVFTSLRRWLSVILRGALKAFWTGVKIYFWPLTALVKATMAVVRPLLNKLGIDTRSVGTTMRSVYNRIIRPVWAGVRSTISGVWHNGIKPVFNALKTGVGAVATAFGRARGAIARSWKKIRKAVRTPVQKVLNLTWNPLVGGISKIPGLGKDWKKKYQVQLKAAGGPIYGPGTGTSDSVPILASHGEYMTKAASVRSLDRQIPGGLDYINETGRWPGYKKGGRVSPLKSRGRGTTYPGHTGLDFAAPLGTPVYAAVSGRQRNQYLTGSYGRNVRIIGDGWHTIYAHLQRIVGRDGRKVKAGTQIGTVDSTGNSTGNHLHFEAGSGIGSTANVQSTRDFLKGAAAPKGGGGMGPLGWIKSIFNFPKKIGGLIGKLKGKLGMLGGLQQLPREAGAALWKHVKSRAADLFSLHGPIEAIKGAGKWAGKKMSGVKKSLLKAMGLAGIPKTSKYVQAWMRQISTESGGNPRAIQQVFDVNMARGTPAKGILQTIPSTFNAYRLPGLGGIFNPVANMVAALRYAKARYGLQGMLNVIGKGMGYETGAWDTGPRAHSAVIHPHEMVLPKKAADQVRAASSNGGVVRLSRDDLDYLAERVGALVLDGSYVMSSRVSDKKIDLMQRSQDRKQRIGVS